MKRERGFSSSSRKIRGKRLTAKEPAPDLNLQKLKEELQAISGGF